MKKEKEKMTLEEKIEKLLENDKEQSFELQSIKRIVAKKEIMFSEDVCDTVGIKPRTLNNWRRDGKIPYMKPGKVAMYNMSKILEFWEAMTKNTEGIVEDKDSQDNED